MMSLFKNSLLHLLLLVFFSLPFSVSASAPSTAVEDTLIPLSNTVFNPNIQAYYSTPDSITVLMTVPPGFYVYADRFSFSLTDGTPIEATLPRATVFYDEFFGDTLIYRDAIPIVLTLASAVKDSQITQLVIHYQGCSDEGICYSPTQKTIPIEQGILTSSSEVPASTTTMGTTNFTALPPAAAAASHSVLSLFTFFGLGLLLAFTPCLFPLIPVVLTLISGKEDREKHWSRLGAYVIGFIAIYVIAAIVASFSGSLVSSLFQSTLFLIFGVLIYILLGMSMFGFWSFDLSQNRLATKVDHWIRQTKPSVSRGFVMGIFSALLSTPCITPPLAGTLLYIAQSGNVGWGILELTALSLGMVLPLMGVALFGRQWLPKSGPWLIRIQRLLGIVLFGMALWLLSPLLPPIAWPIGVTLLVMGALFILGLFNRHLFESKLKKGFQLLLLILIGIGCVYWIGNTYHQSNATVDYTIGPMVTSVAELDQMLNNEPALLFFTAKWCRYCPTVARNLSDVTVLQGNPPLIRIFVIDLTEQTPQNDALVQRFDVFGSPTVIWVDEKGGADLQDRLIGLVSTQDINHFIIQKTKSTP